MSLLERFFVSNEIKEHRLNICKNCEEYAAGICKKCGCVMVAKTPLGNASCPLGKWEAVKEDSPQTTNEEGNN